MNDLLHISDAGLALQKRYEKGPANTSPNGFAPAMYLCMAGKQTIGWGHVITDADAYLCKSTVDTWGANLLLKKDNIPIEEAVKRLVKVALVQCEFDALVSLILNIGIGNFTDSTLLRKLNAGDRRGAADEFLRWNKYTDPKCGCKKVAPGLLTRRTNERAMFLGVKDA